PLGPGLSEPGMYSDPGSIGEMAVFDDGSGPALYVNGDFVNAFGAGATGIAKWNGREWSAVAGDPAIPMNGFFAVYDDGSGPALFATGSIEVTPYAFTP